MVLRGDGRVNLDEIGKVGRGKVRTQASEGTQKQLFLMIPSMDNYVFPMRTVSYRYRSAFSTSSSLREGKQEGFALAPQNILWGDQTCTGTRGSAASSGTSQEEWEVRTHQLLVLPTADKRTKLCSAQEDQRSVIVTPQHSTVLLRVGPSGWVR